VVPGPDLAKLVEKAALAESGLTDQAHDLPAAPAQLIQGELDAGALAGREQLQRGVPGVALAGQHEKNQERHKRGCQQHVVERAQPGQQKLAHRKPRGRWRGSSAGGLRRGNVRHATLDALDALLDPTYGIYPKAELNLNGLAAVLELRAEMGYLKRPVPPLEDYIDRSFYRQATGAHG